LLYVCGMWTQADVNEAVEDIYQITGFDLIHPPSMLELAVSYVGEENVHLVKWPHAFAPGESIRSRKGDGIWLDGSWSLERKTFGFAYEIGDAWLRHHQIADREREPLANAIAAALIAPERVVRLAVGVLGPNPTVMASIFRCTETWAALRMAEALNRPMAVVTSFHVYIRGASFKWGSEEAIRKLVHRSNRRFLKVPVPDDPTHTLILPKLGDFFEQNLFVSQA
jgi:hypothetical protein